eukprot:Pgem_evm1s3345
MVFTLKFFNSILLKAMLLTVISKYTLGQTTIKVATFNAYVNNRNFRNSGKDVKKEESPDIIGSQEMTKGNYFVQGLGNDYYRSKDTAKLVDIFAKKSIRHGGS